MHALLGSGRSSGGKSDSKFSGSKSNSIETWSIDLISGLPGSTLEIWEKGLYEAIECEAPHVSAYDLQVEEKTAFGKWYGDDDSDDDDDDDGLLFLKDSARQALGGDEKSGCESVVRRADGRNQTRNGRRL